MCVPDRKREKRNETEREREKNILALSGTSWNTEWSKFPRAEIYRGR